MKYITLLGIWLFLILPVVVPASEVKEYKLNNGIKAVIVEEHKAPVATFQIWYRVGSRYEPAGKSGISHLVEHMMFKGTPRYGPSQLSRIVQKNGGSDNAYTTRDYTVYFELFSSDRIFLALDLESDRMRNLLMDPKEVHSERDVVMEERRLRYEDDPQNSLFEEVVAAAFKVHPYQRPVIGWMSDVCSLERDDLYRYYRRYYSPRNAFIVIVGDVNSGEMIEKVKAYFEGIPSAPSAQSTNSVEPVQKGERRVVLKKEAELPYVLIAYHTPSFPHEDSCALDVLNAIISGGKSSRLYRSLVYEKKVALNASANYSGLNKDPYLFFFSATAAPGRGVKEVEEALYSEIDRLKREPPSEREVQKAINQIEAGFIMGQDSIYLEAMKYGMFEVLGDWRLMDRYLEGVRKVAPADVSRVTRTYLTEDNRTVGILVPVSREK